MLILAMGLECRALSVQARPIVWYGVICCTLGIRTPYAEYICIKNVVSEVYVPGRIWIQLFVYVAALVQDDIVLRQA